MNVTSSFSHDGLGRVIRAAAQELAGGPVEEQVTQYRYERPGDAGLREACMLCDV